MNLRHRHRPLPRPGRSAYGVATTVVLLLIPITVLTGGDTVRDFLDFGAGVLSLVALSCSVIWGLVATDRLFLTTRQRIVAQAVHRTTALAAVAFLLLHLTVKLALGHTRLIAALIPFGLGVTGPAGLIGLGSAAGLLMIFTALTGALRSAFASPAPVAARWRAVHMLAYPAWCCALLHGLYAGRQAKPIFVFLYALCLIGVMAALALRSAPPPFKRKVTDRVAALLGDGNRPGREEPGASRARTAEAAPTGFDGPPARHCAGAKGLIPPQPTAPRREVPPARAVPPGPGNGFAAAYRAASSTQRIPLPPNVQPTAVIPRFDGGGSGSGSGSAPVYAPLQGTGDTSWAYGDPGRTGYGASEMYDTGETNTPYGAYVPDNTYNSGPPGETLPGAFGAPRAGEPWNAPSGGFE